MADLTLLDGRQANIVLVGSRENPKGATLVVPGEGGGPVSALPLADAVNLLHPQQVIDIICMQQRVYGDLGLDSPFDLSEPS